ncbi:MAG: SDR family oxidoreductase [Paludibacteraceae bacterium]|nr:SDR family oxidoreductase [Paludibacteraceae bacterium]
MGIGLLSGKKGIIFGVVDDNSIAWAIARKCIDEGAQIILTNTKNAILLGNVKDLAKKINTPIIECDATNLDDIQNLFKQSINLLGGKIDFILHSIGMSQNLRRRKNYDNINYKYFEQTIDISAFSLHKILQVAKSNDFINYHGSIVALSYIASHRYVCGYNDMSAAKAILESIVQNFGAIYAQSHKVRINTISQSPTFTRAGSNFNGFKYFYDFTEHMAPLGNADANDCANLCVVLFSDYTKKLTMQNFYNDGGFSLTAMSEKFIDYFKDNSHSHFNE